MSAKLRNWLLGGLGLAIFILGVPLAQRVVATTNAPVANGEKGAENSVIPSNPEKAGHPSVIQVGDQYLQIIPSKNDSVSALLYDSSYKLLAGNENDAALTFTLPSGEKKTVRIVAATMICPKGEHSAGKSDCCVETSGKHPESCPVKEQADKSVHQ